MPSRFILPFVLFLLILSSGGVVPLVLGGVVFYLVILALLVLTIPGNKSFPRSFLTRSSYFIIGSVCILSLMQIINTRSFLDDEFTKFVFRYLISFLLYFCYMYQGRDLLNDIYINLKIVAIHSLLSFALSFILMPFLSLVVVEEKLKLLTFNYIFFYDSTHVLSDLIILRNQGLFWEPGVLSIYLNIFFFLCAFVKNKKTESILTAFLIITTFSTTGFILLLVQLIILFKGILKKNFIYILPALLVAVALVPFFMENITSKFAADNGSFLLRFYDYYISLNIIKDNWLIGIGFGNELYNNAQLTYDIFKSSFLTEPRGNTNSITAIFTSFGIPVGFLILRNLYKQSIIPNNKLLFFFIIVFGLSSEPLIYTGFFMVLIVSGFLPLNKHSIVPQQKLLLNH